MNIQRLHRGHLLLRRCRSCVRFNSNEIKGGSQFAEDTDFANRKGDIAGLDKSTQDQQYYPRIKSIVGDRQILRIPEFRDSFEKCFKDDRELKTIKDAEYVVNGKILSIRKSGKGSFFIDVIQDNQKVQVVAHHKMMNLTKDEFTDLHGGLKPGDFISCVGHPGQTNVGELSLKLNTKISLVSPALHPLPTIFTNPAKIYSHRVVDYLVNKRSRDIIIVRSKIISSIRHFFEQNDFMEVSTPIIGSGNSGANATPFVTNSVHVKDNKEKLVDLNLRVAPELWLKKLIISGFDKVFEIGPVFRNEGLDATHNPEFTTCEFYQTFANMEDLMKITEDLFIFVCNELLRDNKYEISHKRAQLIKDSYKENNNSFLKLDFLKEVESRSGLQLPDELTSEALVKYHQDLNLELPTVLSSAQLLDNLCSTYVEPLCMNVPTFICNQPEELSPLAKSSKEDRFTISHRFELFINGKEYVNAYEEENNPFQQDLKFQQQLRAKTDFKDDESMVPDHKFVEAMEWGMPPTGGWGLGIDRLVMLLTESERIDHVLPFGKLTDVLKQ